ncbi:hypothetical protein [Streptomyces fulvoviolaceus]|uniref:hypothetical protein n=1 Tax=Streptomyces fulvoviolaceus TaxID=285535 RepID=UPI0004C64103
MVQVAAAADGTDHGGAAPAAELGSWGADATEDTAYEDEPTVDGTVREHDAVGGDAGDTETRAEFAGTLARDPRELLLDEPTNHLDVQHQLDLIDGVTAAPFTDWEVDTYFHCGVAGEARERMEAVRRRPLIPQSAGAGCPVR